MSVVEPPADLDSTLRDRFALERFRPGQREVIEQVLAGRDVLCVMPTGGGKSLCYQLPAVMLRGVTIVVSPLIALMKDQVDALTARGIRATLINSTLDPAEQYARIAEIELGRYDLVYVAPERFRSGRFVEAMYRVKPALLAVDEAHCISEWGHDFRPDYARIGTARRALGMPPCIALTATATDLVRRDIAEKLVLRDPAQFVTGFDRPNLIYHAREVRKDLEKLAAVAEVLDRNPGPAIIYASSRKRCEEVGNYLVGPLKRDAVIYHAGMTREERTVAQERFMGGSAEVVVATNAFGMGVDKSDIRSVIHFNMPGTLEAYYQEAGRAGRDGLPSECVLLHAPGDRFLQEMFIENEYPPPDAVYRVYDHLRAIDADPIELTHAEIREGSGVSINESAVGTALRFLETAGAVERFRPRENMAIIRINGEANDPPISSRVGSNAHVQKIVAVALEGLVNRRFGEPVYFQPDGFAAMIGLDRSALTRAIKNLVAEFPIDYVPPFRGNAVRVLDRNRKAREVEIDFATLGERRRGEYDKLERMLGYAQTRDCRRSYILQYFGDADASTCGRCDNCGTSVAPRAVVGSRPIDTPAGREVLQKVLSGVARAKGKFGKTAVAQMLVGSGSEKMEKTGLTRLTTFGVLAKSGFTQKEVMDILDALLAANLIESEDIDRFRPVIKLSELGWDWIRKADPPAVSLALEPYLLQKLGNGGLERLYSDANPRTASLVDTSRPAPTPVVDGGWMGDADEQSWEPASAVMGDPLWEKLKALRLHWSRETNVKAYNIFPNRVLDDLARLRPESPSALAAIKGIGPSTMERYGAAILDAIRSAGTARVESGPIVEDVRAAVAEPAKSTLPPPRPAGPSIVPAGPPLAVRTNGRPDPATPSPYVATEEWTWRLLDRGFSIDEAAAIRGLEVSAIVRHATWMVKKGHAVPLASFLGKDDLELWLEALRRGGTAGPPPSGPHPELWPLFIACREGDRGSP
jgi:ATP-dependent DNA helicase RecQ